MRWSLTTMLCLTAVVAICLATFQFFLLSSQISESRVSFGYYLAILVIASLIAFNARQRIKQFWIGYSVFGCCWLAFGLGGTFGFSRDIFAAPPSFATIGARNGACSLTSGRWRLSDLMMLQLPERSFLGIVLCARCDADSGAIARRTLLARGTGVAALCRAGEDARCD